MSIVRNKQILMYKLANLFTLNILPASYGREELVMSQLSYVEACKFEEKHVVKFLKVKNDIVEYSIAASDRVFLAGIGIMQE